MHNKRKKQGMMWVGHQYGFNEKDNEGGTEER